MGERFGVTGSRANNAESALFDMLIAMNLTNPARFAAIALACIMLMGASCKDKAFQAAAVIIRSTGAAAAVINAEVDANVANMDVAEADRLRSLGKKLKDASDIAAALTNNYANFPSGSRPPLHAVVQPLIVAFQDALASGLTGIKNAALQQRIRVILESVNAGLVIADSALGG